MDPQLATLILRDFLIKTHNKENPHIDRQEVIAHATLSACLHHYPSRCLADWSELVNQTIIIKEIEHSRWIVQRKIAIAKIAKEN